MQWETNSLLSCGNRYGFSMNAGASEAYDVISISISVVASASQAATIPWSLSVDNA